MRRKDTEELAERRAQYLRAVFDAIPLPAFVVDQDVHIHDFNAAAEPLLGAEPATALYRRGGEALHCLNAEPKGCGNSEQCKDCVVRNGVAKALSGGTTHRELHQAELRTSTGVTPVQLLVTAALLPYTQPPRALVVLEDVTQLHTLRGLVPICPACKQVRDDKGYWKQIEQFIGSLSDAEVTQSLCPECAKRARGSASQLA